MEQNGMVATIVAGENHPTVVESASEAINPKTSRFHEEPIFVAYRSDGVRGCVIARAPKFRARGHFRGRRH